MKTPVSDFVTEYVGSGITRFHMPGHKGMALLGCEALDITEIAGADALYEASGIIGESEANATALFGTGKTLFSTEGSSQCVRAMLYLAKLQWQRVKSVTETVKQKKPAAICEAVERPVVVAARNVHKAFIYAAILLDYEIVWLWPEESESLCSCPVTPETLENTLRRLSSRVAAVYITSPDYLGGIADVSALAEVCHKNGTILAVDNAHGAYLHFLESSLHPMDLGADICCDSAHKTLPVLTGGAYLHIGKSMPDYVKEAGKQAMELFGSTSPSYLIMQSLDLCNAYLAGEYPKKLSETICRIDLLKESLRQSGWQVEKTDPLRITVKAPEGVSGTDLAGLLRTRHIECEYADADYLVLMATPCNKEAEFQALIEALGTNQSKYVKKAVPLAVEAERVMSVREAFFADGETVFVETAVGRICRMPMAACPPAIPVVVPGERLDEKAIESFLYYGIKKIDVVKN